MNRCLILLTTASPYVKGESFVSNELRYLSESFEKIIVLALDESVEDKVENDLPDNVAVYEVSHHIGKKGKLIDRINGAIYLIKPNEVLSNEKKYHKNSFKKAVFAGYFESRSLRKYKECLEVLNDIDFSTYDEILIYSYWLFVTARVGIEIKKYLSENHIKASLISRAHGYDLYSYANKLNYLPEREFLLSKIDKVYPCSAYGENYLKEQFPDYADKIKCSYLGTFDRGQSYYDKMFHIVSCSHIVPVKRLDKLIDALSSIKDKSMDIYWTHIGNGSLQEEIENRAKEKLSSVNYEFIGRMDNAQVLEYYKNTPISLLVNVSESEGLPVSIMEAASFGIPVIATDVGGTSEIVHDGINGKLINKDFTDEEFVDALSSVYNLSDEEYTTLRKNSRKIWEDNFNADINYRAFCNLISDDKIKI